MCAFWLFDLAGAFFCIGFIDEYRFLCTICTISAWFSLLLALDSNRCRSSGFVNVCTYRYSLLRGHCCAIFCRFFFRCLHKKPCCPLFRKIRGDLAKSGNSEMVGEQPQIK